MSITLAKIFQNNMLLQREKPVAIWGHAAPEEDIRISIQGHTAYARTNKHGEWSAMLPPLAASVSETMTVCGMDSDIILHDVAIGEVFVAGGQSNMEFWMRYEAHLADALRSCENANIRFYDMPKLSYEGQENDFDYHNVGLWRKATAQDLEFFSAVGYYFARKLEQDLNVPVGIIGCNFGGTRSLTWMTEEHGQSIQPEQCADFEASLNGMSLEEFIQLCRRDPSNDTGNSSWSAFNEFILPRTPDAVEVQTFIDEHGEPPVPTKPQGAPGALYRYMVSKLAPYAVRGVLWYQGESDDEIGGTQIHYKRALEAIMADWRDAWSYPELPFFVVQLPGFNTWLEFICKDFPTIRRCQQQAVDEDPHAYLCSISDVGEEWDIHPKDKRTVGERLALLAEKHLFKAEILADAPSYESATRDGNLISIRFAHAGNRLYLKRDALQALEAYAEDHLIPHSCTLSGNQLRIELLEKTETAVNIRFAQSAWYCVNLYNEAGIPAIPFECTI